MLSRMKLGGKIFAAFAVALALSLVQGAMSYRGVTQVSTHLDRIANQKVPSIEALGAITAEMNQVMRRVNALFVFKATGGFAAEQRSILQASWRALEDAGRKWKGVPHSNKALSMYATWQSVVARWRAEVDRIGELSEERDRLVAARGASSPEVLAVEAKMFGAWDSARKLVIEAQKPIDGIQELTNSHAVEERKAAEDAVASAVLLQAVLVALIAALLVGVALVLSRFTAGIVSVLTREAARLTTAVQAGNLSVRGDAAAVNFEFRGIVEGMNATMEAFKKPIETTASYVDRISKGDLPPKITEAYLGDFNAIKENLNTCIGALQSLLDDARMLANAAAEGRLSERADVTRHQGDYRRVLEGVHGMLDANVAPMKETVSVLSGVAARDLSLRMTGSYLGAFDQMKVTVNAAADALHGALSQVSQAVGEVSSAAGQIASASQSVASGASEQASSLEETSSQLESLAAATKGAAANAAQANALTHTAHKAAEAGGASMERMSGAMSKVKAAAESTSAIIKDINEIAFQTNLLALNAAVEAARAGEAGRGFAVVAEEVRSLALRAKEAATKTEELIRESVRQAGEGEATALEVGTKLSEITSAISGVAGIVEEISASSKEQAGGLAQITTAVGQMDQVTQQNAASSEEASSAAAELAGQSEALAAMVRTFRLEEGPRLGAAPSPQSPGMSSKPPMAHLSSRRRAPQARA